MTHLATARAYRPSSQHRVSAPREVPVAKIVVNIPFVVWRDGKPRYVATPAHRALGFKGEDLKRPDGSWYSLEEAAAWSERRSAEVTERRKDVAAARGARRRIPPLRRPDVYTIGQLMQEWQDPTKNPKWGSEEIIKGKRRIKPLAASTKVFYRHMTRVVEIFDEGRIWAAPTTELTARAARGIYERLCEDRGVAMSWGAMAALSAAWTWGAAKGKVGPSPMSKLGIEKPSARLRVGSVEEMRTLIAAADALGLPEIGDAIVMGLLTGQRQSDRLLLIDGRDLDGRLRFLQKKTGAVVLVPASPQLVERLKGARQRRAASTIQHPELIIDEQRGRPFAGNAGSKLYRDAFREVRAAAVAGIQDGEAWKVAPCPSLEDFRDQDLRDTAVTWLGLAGATIPEIMSLTGHSQTSATQILQHYLGRHPEMAATAVDKAAAWLEAKGGL
ncbi:tyrosine-type recombinase/integrase [Ancylobacter oerskovii]|uniref:Tyrosine-type recombinase/integrase n=1 Tax=Ancylobacter oerskovii TaxID=459519 RepID=A0ABW4YRW5_9HYPH|nr:tyrosine-type recombinase/integrase [Ancylobacter oerskovii]MBS7545654.1 tyrosine-type recombinase/integrase [Ancylobacter oerskovii]